MSYILKEITEPSSKEMQGIIRLWCDSFGDTEEFVRSFYEKMPVHSTICCFLEDIPVSMAVLLDIGGAYYGYAVCTDNNHRRRGLCRQIHEYIKEKCDNEKLEYFVHPADEELSWYYKRLGMEEVSSFYEVTTISLDVEKTYTVSCAEYERIRDLCFGGGSYFPWSEGALSFMAENGISFVSAYIDGVECAAAVDGNTILELCAPEYLTGRAASAFLPDTGKLGTVRFITEPSHADRTAVMSFSGKQAYFNLFFE